MTSTASKQLADAAIKFAAQGFVEYLVLHPHPESDSDRAFEILKEEVQNALPEALSDAKAAMDCHMGHLMEMTFATSMKLAGINAAKRL